MPLLQILLPGAADWPLDIDLQRKAVVALIAWVIAVALVPRHRRSLTVWPLALLVVSPLPFLVGQLFPESPEAPALARDGCRFFLLASLLQSALLIVAVGIWERIARPWPRIFFDVLRWVLFATAFVAVLYESGVNAGRASTPGLTESTAVGSVLSLIHI